MLQVEAGIFSFLNDNQEVQAQVAQEHGSVANFVELLRDQVYDERDRLMTEEGASKHEANEKAMSFLGGELEKLKDSASM